MSTNTKPNTNRWDGRLGARRPTGPRRPTVTARERQILRMVGEGRTDGQIGEVLFIGTRTVNFHVSNAIRKLDCTTRIEAYNRCVEDGLIVPVLKEKPLKTFSMYFWLLVCMASFSARAQAPKPIMPPPDPEGMITVKIIPGVHAVIEAPSDRVRLQHNKGNTIIFIDTRMQIELGKP